MRFVKRITAFVCALSMLNVAGGAVCAESDTSYRQLQDYAIFNGSGNINWCGGPNLEVSGSRIPIDSEVTCDGVSSLRVNITDTSAWWSARLVVRSWMSVDFTPYEAEGYLEFDVKGNAGGEKFCIGLTDHTGEDSAVVPISKYTTLTNQWQHVAVPLKDIAIANPDIDLSDINLLYLQNDGTTEAQKFWITNIEVTSQGLERQSPPIKVNQVGYLTDSQKYAFVSFFPELYTVSEGDAFSICESETGKSVYEGKLELLSEFDQRDSGEKVLKADFSDFKTNGKYFISVEGLENSVNFSISNNVYDEALKSAQRYFYYQRQGTALDEQYAGIFARDDLGLDDSAVPFASGKTGTITAEKGWFDAGDSGKYVNVGSTAVSALLWSYDMFPQIFTDNSLNIPESGNGVPDILDEARWELEWILTMQDSESGGFYPRVQGDAGERTVMDENGCITDDTACAVGVLSEAYLIYKEFDSQFAQKCLASAEKGWEFLENNPENIVGYDVYVVSDDIPDRLWASGALYRATGNESCKEYFEKNHTYIESKFEDSYAMGNRWGDNWQTGCWNYLLADNPSETVSQWLADEYALWREVILTTKWKNNIWKVPLHKGNYFRGITAEICNMAMGVSITDEILNLDDSRTFECAETSLSWLLGANPLSLSYVSGCGENSIRTIYSQIYEADAIEEIPPGYMPQGPNYTAMKTICRFAAKCYMESDNDWVTNEHTVYGNAVLVYLLAEAAAIGSAEPVKGDVNADGAFNVADLVMLQNFLVRNGELTDWQAGDLCNDRKIDVFDSVAMRQELITSATEN